MTNSVANGNVVDFVNGTGDTITGGSLVSLGGGLVGCLVTTAVDGAKVAANITGAYSFASAGFDGVQGQPVFYDTVAEHITDTAGANTEYAGVLYKDCSLGDSTVVVIINAGSRAQAAPQADSVAANIAAMVVDFNALLAKLRVAGVIAQ